MTATYIFWICIGVVALIVTIDFVNKCRKADEISEANDPQNEETPYQFYFKHPSGRTYSQGMSEKDAITFAQNHPFWYVTVSNGVDLKNAYWEKSSDYWNLYE